MGRKGIENKNVASGKRVEEVNEERRRRPERGDVRTTEPLGSAAGDGTDGVHASRQGGHMWQRHPAWQWLVMVWASEKQLSHTVIRICKSI